MHISLLECDCTYIDVWTPLMVSLLWHQTVPKHLLVTYCERVYIELTVLPLPPMQRGPPGSS